MTGLDAFRIFCAVQNHFKGNLEYFKTSGKIKASEDAFMARKDKYGFVRLGKDWEDEKEFATFLAVNFADNLKMWVRDFGPEAVKKFENWKISQKDIVISFQTQLEALGDVLDACRAPSVNEYPKAITRFLQGELDKDTLIWIDRFTEIFAVWARIYGDDVVMKDILGKLEKYGKFAVEWSREKEKELRSVLKRILRT